MAGMRKKGDAPLKSSSAAYLITGVQHLSDASVLGEKERRWIDDATHSLPVPRSFSQTVRPDQGIGLEGVCVSFATGSRFRIAKDVPVLRAYHVAVEGFLPGVREVAGSGYDEIKK
jgi:hypothetical protein